MARAVLCLGVFGLGLAIAAPASAQQHQHGGYIAVSKLQIDPHMNMLNDGPDPKQLQQMQQQRQTQVSPGAPAAQGGPGSPLDQMDDQDQDAPIGDDPVSDNADDSDAVYTA